MIVVEFSYAIDKTVDLTPQAKSGGLPKMIQNIKIQSSNRHRQEYLGENSEWENHSEERGRFHYLFLCVARGFFSLYFLFFFN